MTTVQRVILFAFLCTVAGCATRGDMRNLERADNDAKKRIVALENEMTGVRQMANDEVRQSLTDFRGEMATIRKGAADLQSSQDTIQVNMREMSGKIDDLKILVKRDVDDAKFQKEEMDRRLAALEERLAKLEKTIDTLKLSGDSPVDSTPDGIYQQGIAAVKAGEMAKARELFTRLVEEHPSHALIPNCYYWIGETYYGEKKYEQAILEFQETIKKYPKSDKAPAALLKQALSFENIGDKKSARYVLTKLRDTYPQSEEAKKVKKLLKGL